MAKIEPPFPSSPMRPPRYSLSFLRGDKLVRQEGFYATYAALAYVTAIVGGNEIRWRGEDAFLVPDLGIVVKGDKLEDIMDYEPKGAEKEFVLPEPFASDAQCIATGERRVIKPKHDIKEQVDKLGQDSLMPDDKPRRTRTPKPSRDGLISLGQLCEDIGMEPRDARAILRKKMDKPDTGWAWPTDEASKIKTLLSGKTANDGGDKTPTTTPRKKYDAAQGTKAKAPQAGAKAKKKR